MVAPETVTPVTLSMCFGASRGLCVGRVRRDASLFQTEVPTDVVDRERQLSSCNQRHDRQAPWGRVFLYAVCK